MNRRQLVLGAAAAAGMVTEGVAVAGTGDRWTDDRVQAVLGRIRAGMARARDRVSRSLAQHGYERVPIALAFLDATPAVHAYGSLHDLPLEAQVHPDVQALAVEVVEQLGTSATRMREALGALSAETLDAVDRSLREEPQRIERMLAETTALAEDVEGGPVRVRFGDAQGELRWRVAEHGVARTVAHLRSACQRVEDLVARRGADAMQRPPAHLEKRVARAREAWGALGVRHTTFTAATAGQTVGIILGGVLIVGGVVLIGAGIALTAACPCLGIPVILVGGLVIWGGVAAIRASTPDRVGIEISPDEGWTKTGWVVAQGVPLSISVSGEVRIDGAACGPEGLPDRFAGPGAVAKGLPLGALVGRTNDEPPFLVGAGPLKTSSKARVDLAVNVEVGMAVTGHFTVTRVGEDL